MLNERWWIIRFLKKILPDNLVGPLLPYWHLARAILANIKYGFPARHLNVIGITGTNGKTTTAYFITSILETAGQKVGLSSTATFKIGDKNWNNDLNVTVTNPFRLQKLLHDMKAAKVDWVVMEVTSHGLKQNRFWGVPFHTAAITNLTQDHLDYHQTMDQYAAAKAKLFKVAKHNAVLNHDDEWFNYFAQIAQQHKFTYGVAKDSDVRLTKANLKAHGSSINFNYGHDEHKELSAKLNLTGKFNVYNALAAASIGLALELSAEQVKTGLENLTAVPGRMETVKAGQDFAVLVDYAHTPDALRNLFETLRPLTHGKLIAVFGATGDRDKTKRPLMGSLAAKLTDVVIITDDDPYTEDPAAIRKEVMDGTKQTHAKAEVIEIGDRHDAIARAFHMAKYGDTVAILGLGHQHFRVVGDKKEPWDDRAVAKKLLDKKKSSQ